MNEVIVLESEAVQSDGFLSTIRYEVAENLIKSYLRKIGKSVDEYESTEEVIRDFLKYCSSLNLEEIEYER